MADLWQGRIQDLMLAGGTKFGKGSWDRSQGGPGGATTEPCWGGGGHRGEAPRKLLGFEHFQKSYSVLKHLSVSKHAYSMHRYMVSASQVRAALWEGKNQVKRFEYCWGEWAFVHVTNGNDIM